jgi:hypothetical protein
MGRRRTKSLGLPEGIHQVRSKGRTYYYYRPGRGTSRAARPIKIFGDPLAPIGTPENERFWRELNHIVSQTVVFPSGSVKALIDEYRDDEAFKRLSPRSRTVYNVLLNRFAKPHVWGLLPAKNLTPPAVKVARDGLSDTPGMANQMLSVGRTLYAWAIPLGLVNSNPFESVKPLETVDRGHVPWPDWIVEEVLRTSWEDRQRMVRLGIMTCQRESDLVRLGPMHCESVKGRGKGIWCRPKKNASQTAISFYSPAHCRRARAEQVGQNADPFSEQSLEGSTITIQQRGLSLFPSWKALHPGQSPSAVEAVDAYKNG